MVLGPGAMERLVRARVILFGLGGVGSWCAEALVRTGLVECTLVDSDTVCPTNINRQAQATSLNIGESKAMELRKRLLSINPDANITARHAVYDEGSADSFDLGEYDYVIDAIDSIKNKILLIEKCQGYGVTLFSSMGAGNKRDPSRIRVDRLLKTKQCPLARLVRKGLRKRNLSADFICVYSDEPPSEPLRETPNGTGECDCPPGDGPLSGEVDTDRYMGKKRINGALVHVTAVFGFTLAGLVINDVAGRG